MLLFDGCLLGFYCWGSMYGFIMLFRVAQNTNNGIHMFKNQPINEMEMNKDGKVVQIQECIMIFANKISNYSNFKMLVLFHTAPFEYNYSTSEKNLKLNFIQVYHHRYPRLFLTKTHKTSIFTIFTRCRYISLSIKQICSIMIKHS